MENKRSLIVGLDLCETYTQLSVINKSGEPETINMFIPTALGITHSKKEWLIGEDAYECENKGEGIVIDKLLEKVSFGQEVEVLSVTFSPITLLEKYLRKCLLLLKKYFPNETIRMLCITLEDASVAIREGITTALQALGIENDRFMIQNHTQSYGFYALSQPKELWMNDIGLFEFNEDGLVYKQISLHKKTDPMLAFITCKDLKEELNLKQVLDIKDDVEKERLNHYFLNISKNLLYKQYVTTLYATGKGFEGDWADKALKELCLGRRVFKGQNLYSKGACYAANLMVSGKESNFLLVDDEIITADITLKALNDGNMSEVYLIKGVLPWYNAKSKIEFILDQCDSLYLSITDRIRHMEREEIVYLSDLPKRPNKTTRIEVLIAFINKERVKITVIDKGFGEFYPATGQVWEQEFAINN